MSPRISREEVEHVARLARLALSEEEKAGMGEELSSILAYIDQLRELDTSDVEPTSHAIPMVNVMREDEVRPSYPVDAMLQNAPEREGDLVRVPKIIEE
ncbi:MAG: Asp-tRNA(Asn)/Glu-tRNA(Gln) amidotransferase subunit GatC [Candidatus Rokubacteria bacterium]|nr:Asp-tRNA(Asn)/Glu-tRNA(Gln) amidotransferase subunit GatC [Candidatus Rokubacteria bacterium]